MKHLPTTAAEPPAGIDMALFDTARRRAERLREAAIDQAAQQAAGAGRTLLRAVRARLQAALRPPAPRSTDKAAAAARP